MERALIAYLWAAGRDDDPVRLRSGDVTGLVGWGALAYVSRRRGEPAPPANEVPWGRLETSPAPTG